MYKRPAPLVGAGLFWARTTPRRRRDSRRFAERYFLGVLATIIVAVPKVISLRPSAFTAPPRCRRRDGSRTQSSMSTQRPASDEYAPYYEKYISLVRAGDIIDILREQGDVIRGLLARVPNDR